MILTTSLLVIGAATANAACVPFQGGPAEGMCPGPLISRNGPFEIVRLLPASRPGAAISPELRSTLSALLKDRRKRGAVIDQRSIASGATERFCATFSTCSGPRSLKTWPFGKTFVANSPYLLADGRIRIEWMRNGTLEYISLITFEGVKMLDVSTLPAEMPQQATPD